MSTQPSLTVAVATNWPSVFATDEAKAELLAELEAARASLRQLVGRVEFFVIQRDAQPMPAEHGPHSIVTSPARWLGEGRTDLQKGFMSLERAIQQPVTF